ncbi:oxalate/formate MFS antiporter [Streptomyces sp. NPDC050560]|uniref:oxalate/formate MFS antiporter n=1 Tax=Streptomyces sp. NPDC050560 TaxID=3365630 RepID=UPI00378B13CA
MTLIAVATVAAANLQYCWTLFSDPLADGYDVSLAHVQIAFSLFIIAQTWLLPVEGWLVDRYGPRLTFLAAGALVGLSWIGTADFAPSIEAVWAWYLVGGAGVGIIYGGGLGVVVKWFPDRRGLVAGISAACYGSGTLLTITPISHMIDSTGYRHTLLVWGIVLGAVCCACAVFLRAPDPAATGAEPGAAVRAAQTRRNLGPAKVLRTPTFWALYLATTLMSFTGLVITAQIGPIAKDYGADETTVAFGLTGLTLAIQLDRVLNGISRPIWGWVSDRIGRYTAMTIAFTFQAAGIVIWMAFVDYPVFFIICSGFVYIGWSEIYSMGAAMVADLYGPRFAATNYGVLFTGKGFASILAGPVTAWLVEGNGGNWIPVFATMAACAAAAAALVFFWLRPAAARLHREEDRVVDQVAHVSA